MVSVGMQLYYIILYYIILYYIILYYIILLFHFILLCIIFFICIYTHSTHIDPIWILWDEFFNMLSIY